MKKTFILLLTLLPLACMAQWKTSNDQKPINDDSKKGFFTFGIHQTTDFYKGATGIGLGMMANIGRFTDLLNVSFGVEYIEYLAGDPRPEDEKNALSIVDAGAQLIVPAYLKLNLFRTSKWTKFYIGCGAEVGMRLREGGVLKHYYEEGHVLSDHSVAITPMIGWKSRNLDFGLYYKNYLDKPFNNSIKGDKNLGDDKARIGYHFTYYF